MPPVELHAGGVTIRKTAASFSTGAIASVTRIVDARLDVNLLLECNSLQATRPVDKRIVSTSTVPLLNERWTKREHHTLLDAKSAGSRTGAHNPPRQVRATPNN